MLDSRFLTLLLTPLLLLSPRPDDPPATATEAPARPLLVVHYEPGRKGEILATDADGGDVVNLSMTPRHTDNYPSWSPDGERIAFNSHRSGGWAVWVMDADGSDVRRLVTTGRRTLNPSWSPDGEWLTFFGDPNGFWNIGVARSDGTGLRWLAEDESINRDPVFTPDGRRILFYSTRDERDTSIDLDLFLVDRDGERLENLTDTDALHEFAASFSPDGSEIACYELPVDNSSLVGNVVVMKADGTERRRVAPAVGARGKDYRDFRLCWTADGESIVFVSYTPEGDAALWRVPSDGSSEFRSFLELDGGVADPSWSPVGGASGGSGASVEGQ